MHITTCVCDASIHTTDAWLAASGSQESLLYIDSHNGWWRNSLVTQPLPLLPELSLSVSGCYVITGGLGGLGRILARQLLCQPDTEVIVLGRQSPADAIDTINEMTSFAKEHHSHWRYLSVNITDEVAVAIELLPYLSRLKGVFHLAGALQDSYLVRKPLDGAYDLIRSKVLGAYVLDRVTRKANMELFCCFSSISATFGNAGQSDYAFANGFLNGFCEQRTAEGAPGKSLSVSWPWWRDGGMLVAEEEQIILSQLGMKPLESKTGIAILSTLLAKNTESSVAILQGEEEKLRQSFSLEQTGSQQPESAKQQETDSSLFTDKSDPISGATEEMKRYLMALFVKETRRIPGTFTENDEFGALGIDSLIVIQISDHLEKALGKISKTLLFENNTIAELASAIVEEYGPLPGGKKDIAAQENKQLGEHQTSNTIITEEKKPLSASQDIAIIGLSGRFPQADSLDEFWQNLCDGKDCIEEIPSERWDRMRFFDQDRQRLDTTFTRWGGFLRNVTHFDAQAFNISPREASIIDPQARLFLETTWHAIEDAGYSPKNLIRGTETDRDIGVFVGVMYGEYQLHEAEERLRGMPILANSSYWSIANRVSYFFDFQGPSMAIDTACSSSLTALHVACESLLNGSCQVAIAGGVNVSIHPNKYFMLAQGRFASGDGRCRSFGEGGYGYVAGEGVGAVLLKPLDAAIRDGDHIYAVIKGSAVNHGGKTNGYTVPNPRAQANLK
ncbi:beta-ketoacyl synthase N-terminal-like domain-containing protein [Xenorhabdus koppenhoeferi]|uniref:beta-ketoacyl synthase N-terminal-like domain-containing protein n=1 Tax=Xenorhabdus koppenhoeferi TaxID=351659 RepID=UPI000B835847|nr:beta-ketoacyl synthase N-terminal-like domain-containing protein [Xenorhabdus koppenhoeferi]